MYMNKVLQTVKLLSLPDKMCTAGVGKKTMMVRICTLHITIYMYMG